MKYIKFLPELVQPQDLLFKTFREQHENFKNHNPFWSLSATRRRLITSFWVKNVFENYVSLFLGGILISLAFNIHHPVQQLLIIFFLVFLLVFPLLFASIYYPAFHNEFLTQLDNCIECYKGKQLEGIQECKKQQHSVITLMLIQHIFQQLAALDPLINNSVTVKILARQYGISVKSVDSALNLILKRDWDRNSVRKRTEILNDFEAAKEHFRQLSSDKAITLLEQLQQKILHSPAK